MKKLSFLFIFTLACTCLFAQQKINIESAESLEKSPGSSAKKLKGNVVFRQESIMMRCDSALFFDETNSLEARGNIYINQADTIHLYGDNLFYDGNTKKARVTGNVRLADKTMTLTTSELDYDLQNKLAYYPAKGLIISGENRLTSDFGTYYSGSREFFFKRNVLLENPDYTINCDTLKYNTISNTAFFFGPSTIKSKDNTIYCEYGWYDTENEKAQFSKRASIVSKENSLEADSMTYNRTTGLGRAWRNIVLNDTVQKIKVFGGYGEYDRLKLTTMITRKPVVLKFFEQDTLFLTSDTIFEKTDTLKKSRTISAYRNARIFKSDMQGLCDSLAYSFSDSMINMLGGPILWTGNNQMTGDTVKIALSNNKISRLYLRLNSFIASVEDSTKYNQIKGKYIESRFSDNNLYRILVDGNAQSIYYAREDSVTFSGVNEIESSNIIIRVESNKIKEITFLENPKGLFSPIGKKSPDDLLLQGFRWHEAIRPRSREEFLR